MIDITLLVIEKTFNELKKNKKVQIRSKSNYNLDEEIYISNREVTSDVIVGKISGKEKIKSTHEYTFLYTIECK